jgi:hypothetical protein
MKGKKVMICMNVDPLLKHKHSGRLKVIIHTIGGLVQSFALDFEETSLFAYIGEACARIFTNMTTVLSIQTCPEDWSIMRYSPEDQILEAQQISGDDLDIVDDDDERLSWMIEMNSNI